MKVSLAYGEGFLDCEVPENTTVITPSHAAPLADERTAVLAALDEPIESRPLRELVAGKKICLSFSDISRATPNERIIPWVLNYLDGLVPDENITLINQTGTHRPNTKAELEKMLTPAVVARYRVLNHECEDSANLVKVGAMEDGTPLLINRHVVEADFRIVTGFIEPHFFAGFSGGPKGIMPGTAGMETIMANHGSKNVGSDGAAFGITDGNPLWENLRDIALMAGPSFVLNVTLDTHKNITGVFAGDLIKAHRVGCEFVRRTAMQEVDNLFDVVVTTNSGYPLDLNLYQTVKGISAAARIVKPNGVIIIASECREGAPPGCPYEKLAASAPDIATLLEKIETPGFRYPEQWQAHVQALIQRRARVMVYSSVTPEELRMLHLEPCTDISASVRESLATAGSDARCAVLPYGPLTVPYVKTVAK